ncbi:MAG: hypothetical protein LBC64_08145 [Fibromonadaceae bacterium]|nr:hypothetical protein [Fibromonadaceae bacterium]
MENTENKTEKEIIKVGLVMPISETKDFFEGHWKDVQEILKGFLKEIANYDFECEMVSYSKEVNLIHSNIVKNLYESDLVICDISGLNPNVMLEMGIRLTFDKPIIVIKDKETDYPFDIKPLEYIPYSRDLNYTKMLEFKKDFLNKIEATIKEYKTNSDYSPFLKYFGSYKAMSLDKQYEFMDVINSNMLNILDKISYMQKDIDKILNEHKEEVLKKEEKGMGLRAFLEREIKKGKREKEIDVEDLQAYLRYKMGINK